MFSIRQQLTRHLFAVGTVLMGAALGAFYLVAKSELAESFDDLLRAKAYSVSSLTDQEDGKVAFDFSEDFFRYFDSESPFTCFQIWDAEGEKVFASRHYSAAELPKPNKGTASQPEFRNIHLPGGVHARVISFVFNPRAEEGREAGWDPDLIMQVSVAMTREEIDNFQASLFFVSVGCWIIFTGFLFFAARRVLRKGLSSLDQLGRQLARLDDKTLSARVVLDKQPRELTPIVDHLNELLARLEASFLRERRFNTAVAHELRTPLAELRSMAECAIEWPESREPTMDKEILDIALRMQSMMTRMLAISRGEMGNLATNLCAVEVSAQMEATWKQFVSRAEARKLKVHLNVEPSSVQVDPVFFQSILVNLFENAVDYAPVGSEILISGRRGDGSGYVLEFSNPAPMMSVQDASQIFDAFWRKEAARSDEHHSGLGLSLSRAFAIAMNWTLAVSLTDDGQIIFTLATKEG
ncbi:MAG: sensor histidine kinase N-terminal domain-containing protein [Puniceicoccales bacterium]|jgi:two-component system sensor histidine kinase QseC|nr:sensor histidine kinase N-terminal domain-containing protein [Puniceicoccales bacterium]